VSYNEPKKSTKTTYELTMSNDYKAQIDVLSSNPTEKVTYIKHFLDTRRHEDVYFVDKLTSRLYNKHQIVSCEQVGEVPNE
jgi:hypothetical protein